MVNYYEFPAAVSELFIDNTLRAVQAVGLAQEQAEKMTKMALDNHKAMREEGLKFAQRYCELARESHRQFYTLANSAVRVGVENYRQVTQQTLDEMGKQAERFNKQVEAVTPKVAKN